MSTFQEILIHALCALVAMLMLFSPIFMFFGFFLMPSWEGKVLFYLGAIALMLAFAGMLKFS